MKRFILIFILISAAFFASSCNVFAGEYGGYGQYSVGGRAPSILVDKMVAKPVETKGGKVDYNYVDNLTATDFKFKPNQYIFFRVSVKNTSDRELFNVTLYDYAPLFLTTVVLEEATYDEKTRTLSRALGSFAPNEEKIYIVKARVATADKLPEDKGLICLVNKTEVKNADASDEDTSQFCIEKEVMEQKITKGGQPVETVQSPSPTQIPSTGPEFGFAIVGLSTLMGYVGLKLRKFK